jgi:hypothetical protein
MTDRTLQSLIDAPLADPLKLAIHGEPRKIKRGPRVRENDDIGAPKLTRAQLDERKDKARWDKLDKLYAYYAGTDLSIERIAEHMGIYRQEQTGVDEKTGKPIFVRKLDLKDVEANIEWRRRKTAAA